MRHRLFVRGGLHVYTRRRNCPFRRFSRPCVLSRLTSRIADSVGLSAPPVVPGLEGGSLEFVRLACEPGFSPHRPGCITTVVPLIIYGNCPWRLRLLSASLT